MSKKTYKEKLWKTDRDRQIEKAVELSKLPVKELKRETK